MSRTRAHNEQISTIVLTMTKQQLNPTCCVASWRSNAQVVKGVGKKELLGLIFKKIIIKNSRNSAAENSQITPFYYSPFDKLISEEENAKNGNRKAKIAPLFYKNVRLPSWIEVYDKLKIVLERLFDLD